MYNKNSSGPSTLPWGTPNLTLSLEEFMSSILTY